MFVCLCNALREKDCHEAAAHPATRGVGCVYRRLGCRVRCGACLQTMREILAQAQVRRMCTGVEVGAPETDEEVSVMPVGAGTAPETA